MENIDWEEFRRIELRVGTITAVEAFPQARRAAFKLTVDFGPTFGTRRCSAQITDLYDHASLLGHQVICVINFPPKQIGPFASQCLVTGFYTTDGSVVLAVPERPVENGAKLG